MRLAPSHSATTMTATFTGATTAGVWQDWVEMGTVATSADVTGFSLTPPINPGQKFQFGVGETGAVVETGPVATFVQLPAFTVDDQWRTALLSCPWRWFHVPAGVRLWVRWMPGASAGSSSTTVTVVLRPVSRP